MYFFSDMNHECNSEANTEAPPEGVTTGCKSYVDKAGMFDSFPSLQVWHFAEIVVDC